MGRVKVIHYLNDRKNLGWCSTPCGLRGMVARGYVGQYDAVKSFRFAALPERDRVTCRRCRVSLGVGS